jgi:hypothetical protein
MGNVLEKAKQEQVIALGRLGWSLRRIEAATGVRRETASGYLRSAGVGLRAPGGWGHGGPAKPAIEVTTGFFVGSGPPGPVGRRSSCSSDAYREWIELELSRGRNATGIFQDLVDQHGFTGSYESVKRFVRKLRGPVCDAVDPHRGCDARIRITHHRAGAVIHLALFTGRVSMIARASADTAQASSTTGSCA